MPPIIDIICVAYRRPGPLKVLIQCFLNQSFDNWRLTAIHDGQDAEFSEIIAAYSKYGKVGGYCTERRYNDFGHSLRALGLERSSSDYVLLTNDDNYYVPKFVEIVSCAVVETQADVVLFDMIHSHDRPGGRPQPSYSFFPTSYKRLGIDIGAAIVRTSLAKAAGFRDKTHDGDATYFEDVLRVGGATMTICKLNRVLFVHN